MASDWRVRTEDDDGAGKPIRFERLAQGLQDGVWGANDQVQAPQSADWTLIGECDALEEFLPPRPLFRRTDAEEAEMDMTPMIDVTFQLLIFFMIAATYVVQKTLALPPLSNEELSPPKLTMSQLASNNIIIRVADDSAAIVDGTRVPWEHLTAAIVAAAKAHPAGQPEVALDMADNVTQATVVKVLDAAGGAQIEKVHFISRSKRPGASSKPASPPALPMQPGN